VIERYQVGLVLLPQMPHTSQLQRAWLEELERLLHERKVAYRFAWQGQRLVVSDDLQIQLLGPFAEAGAIYAPGRKTNNAAVLARADFSDLSLLLTSDAEAQVERKLVGEYEGRNVLDVDILKAGHHGSKTSTTAELLAAASPGAVVISVGKDNRYGHPHPIVMGRLDDLTVWRTDEDGSVRFVREREQWLAPQP
jgi:competence protein ComEC